MSDGTSKAPGPVMRWIDRVLETLLFLALAVMVTVVFANVFCRFVLNFSISWGEEVAQILMCWLTFLGAAVAMRDKEHFAFDYLVRVLPPGGKKAVVLFSHIVVILSTAALLYWSARVTVEIREWVMPATEVTRSLVYGACPTGCFFLLIYAVRNFLADVRAERVEAIREEEAL